MSELILAALVVLAAGFAHASTPVDTATAETMAQSLELRFENGDKTVSRDSTIETTYLSDDNTECFIRPAHGTDASDVECYTN